MIHSVLFPVARTRLSAALSVAILSLSLPVTAQTQTKVEVLDSTMNPASNFLAYTEFELSGEPLVEALGLDLDVLDPDALNQPTVFDYAAGINSYEYSEEAMYALNYQSQMGPHLANGPLNQQRGGTLKSLSDRIQALSDAVGRDSSKVPDNLYLLSLPYASGSPHFQGPVNTTSIGQHGLEVEVNGDYLFVNESVPAYRGDFSTLVWDTNTFDRAFVPAAIGGILLKEVMWSQDFLGGMHVTESDEEVEADSAVMDHSDTYSLGVSAFDGFNGMVLTEEAIDKLLILRDQLAFNGKTLGTRALNAVGSVKGTQRVWFPHRVTVEEKKVNGVNAIGKLTVADGRSTLRDHWQLLWPLAEFFAMTDQRQANKDQNPAFLAVFDGAPFAAAPQANTDADPSNDVVGKDAFSLAADVSSLVFKNLQQGHFNEQLGTFVDEVSAKGVAGNQVTAFDAAYSLVALSIYQRALDAMPVGYASADSSNSRLHTEEGKAALAMLRRQADFLITHLMDKQGVVSDSAVIKGTKVIPSQAKQLDAQFAAVRGLTAAFTATQDERYFEAARRAYLAAEQTMYDKTLQTWVDQAGVAEYTPNTLAAISGALRSAMLNLKNQEGETLTGLDLQTLVSRYQSWFNGVVNGGMQMSEALGDSGEHILLVGVSDKADSDQDGVKKTTHAGGKYGIAPVLANKARISGAN
ncbi:hypothetical protein [Litoribrevibacter albus]|uniref:DUF4856 domain-containing protein n=1 Tax=Litoribrevibacter albus TaxID=1473156 RepID=A0AA37SE09_9GAMM|nr:hypothetical protein [Litoribrevibacter albus]GLQ32477.1 hypothetical protein GCM10007876_29560 [Litoribrevibacter albus]